MSTGRLLSRRDLEFLLYEWLDVERLTQRERFAEYDRDMFDGVLDLAEQLGTEVFAPINRTLDENEPHMGADGRVEQPAELRHALDVFSSSGLIASSVDAELGGAQLPFTLQSASMAYLAAGSLAAYAYPFLSGANANLLIAHGTPEQVETYAVPILEGRWFGTMCLSETQAGSSLGDIATIALPQDDGSYRLSGSKMWISGGEHDLAENIVHLVLARTPDAPAGSKGLSLFIVPRQLPDASGGLGERNDVALTGLNHKMGYRGTTNTLLAFGGGAHLPRGKAGAVGFLVGERNAGLPIMFHMMNEARIGVGLGAAALGYTGYLHSLAYARERPQGRAGRAVDPGSPPSMIIDHPDVRRMLLAQKSYAEGGLALILFCAHLVDDERTALSPEAALEAAELLALLTPVAKSWTARWCLSANDLAIQVLGGYGYTRDFPVEQFYRDNRLNMIHEGTHGIQALDLMGRKILSARGDGLARLGARMERTISAARDRGNAPARHADSLAKRIAGLHAALGDGSEPDALLANATVGMEAIGHLVVAWLWLEQEIVAHGESGAFYEGKCVAAEYFFAHELPAIDPWLDTLRRRDRLFLDLDTKGF